MATVKQVLAAISQDGTLGPNQKRFVTEAINRAETWIDMQPNARKPMRRTSKLRIPLADWEKARGKELHYTDIESWANKEGLSELCMREMIEVFREQMFAKTTPYADFAMAFKVYLRNGWLPKKLPDCRVQSATVIHNRGINL